MRTVIVLICLMLMVTSAAGSADTDLPGGYESPAAAFSMGSSPAAGSCTNQSDCSTGTICCSGRCRDATIDTYSYSDEIYNASAGFLESIRARQLNVVTAESLTSGMIVSSLVDVPNYGSSIYGGFATYDSDAKRQYLGVRTGDVYTKECSLEMATGALVHSRALVGIAVTGKAGPVDKNDLASLGIVDVGVAIRTDKAAAGSDHPADPSFPQTFTTVSRRIDTCGADGHPATRAACEKYRIEAAANERGFVSPGVLQLTRKLIRQDTVLNAVRIAQDHVEQYNCAKDGELAACPGLSGLCKAGYDGDYVMYGEPSPVINRHLGGTACTGNPACGELSRYRGITLPGPVQGMIHRRAMNA